MRIVNLTERMNRLIKESLRYYQFEVKARVTTGHQNLKEVVAPTHWRGMTAFALHYLLTKMVEKKNMKEFINYLYMWWVLTKQRTQPSNMSAELLAPHWHQFLERARQSMKGKSAHDLLFLLKDTVEAMDAEGLGVLWQLKDNPMAKVQITMSIDDTEGPTTHQHVLVGKAVEEWLPSLNTVDKEIPSTHHQHLLKEQENESIVESEILTTHQQLILSDAMTKSRLPQDRKVDVESLIKCWYTVTRQPGMHLKHTTQTQKVLASSIPFLWIDATYLCKLVVGEVLQETATTLEHAFELLAQYSLQAYSMHCMETYLDAQEIHVIMNGNHQVDQETLLTYGTKTIKESDTWFLKKQKGLLHVSEVGGSELLKLETWELQCKIFEAFFTDSERMVSTKSNIDSQNIEWIDPFLIKAEYKHTMAQLIQINKYSKSLSYDLINCLSEPEIFAEAIDYHIAENISYTHIFQQAHYVADYK